MHQVVLAGNAETHPQASFIVGLVVVIAVVALAAWLLTRK